MKILSASAALVLILSGSVSAADTAQRKSVLELFNAIPQLPATAGEAAKWVVKGNIVHPGFLALKADIEAHKRSMEAIAMAGAQKAQAQGAAMAESLGKGLADVGIDMERMKTDPAYAQQVQERMKKMSPAELMAMAQVMNKPVNQDPRIQNEAKAMVEDPAPVQEAARAGEVFSNGMSARIEAHRALWKASDATVKTIAAKPLNAGAQKPATPYDSPACDKGCLAAWDAYAGRMLPLLIARDTEILQSRRAVFEKERASKAAAIQEANRLLLAAHYGASAQSQGNRAHIVSYDSAVLGDIEMLLQRMEDIVKQAALRVNCGKQVVLAPGTVCQ